MYPSPQDKKRKSKLMSGIFLRLLRRCAPPKEIDGFCCGRIEIATVAALLRNDIRGLLSFLCILGIISGARNDKLSKWTYPILFGCSSTAKKDFDLRVMNHIPLGTPSGRAVYGMPYGGKSTCLQNFSIDY